jgi:hypothetical protein
MEIISAPDAGVETPDYLQKSLRDLVHSQLSAESRKLSVDA